jgi:ABC-type transporter Mla subunit MlaD
MVGIAIAGVIVAIGGTIVAWRLVGEVSSTLDETLTITGESVTTVEDTIALADVVVSDLADGLVDLDSALTELDRGLGEAQPVIEDVGRLSSDVPDALTRFQTTLDGVAGAAAEVDSVLRQLDALPFGPDVTPQSSLSGQLQALSGDLDPLITTLRTTSTDLGELTTTTAGIQRDVAALATDIDALNTSLQESSELVRQYRQQAQQAGELASDSRDDLGQSTRLMRILILAGGLLFAVSQFVPLWVGLELLEQPSGEDDDRSGPLRSSAAPGATAARRR